METIQITEQSCGNCKCCHGSRSFKGNITILESAEAECSVQHMKRGRRSNICTKFVRV